MIRKILSYGTVAGLIVGVPLFVMTVALNGHPPLPYGVALGYLTMLIALSAVFVAIKRHRDVELGGVIRFWPALRARPRHQRRRRPPLRARLGGGARSHAHGLRLRLRGGSDRAAEGQGHDRRGAGARSSPRWSSSRPSTPIRCYRLPMTFAEIFPVGLLVSLVSAALLRNSRFLPGAPRPAGDSPTARPRSRNARPGPKTPASAP